ncbi:very short patch repair endonuclease [Gimesia algae]|uniref:Very short patch repair endonuclease n=1 Tax=Gimesia algae TaxID=2527971 RepID=A0A517VLF9_9PLAN|nr:DNA mismatch endonuclease Vsr [Gimesia algae]QDT93852.1 Very short patch repair protein [Gimesia algae]
MDHYSKIKRSKLMSRVRSKDTKPEKIVRKLLHSTGYRFRLHRKDLPGKPDIVLPKYHAAIFVHGCFWHGHDCPKGRRPITNREFWDDKLEKNKKRDARNTKLLKSEGWKVIVIWECETQKPDTLQKKLKKRLSIEKA